MLRLLVAVALLPVVSLAADKPKLITLSLLAPTDLPESTVTAMNDAIATEAGRRGYFEVLSAREVQVLLGLERQKQLVGCAEDSSSCLSELSGAIGARFVMSGSLAKIGASWQLSLQTQDTKRSQVAGRSMRIAKDLQTLRGLIPWMVAEATATPLPPLPSKILPVSLMIGGGLLALASGYVGVQALQREAAVKRELQRGEVLPGLLGRVAEYQAEQESLRWQKTASIVGLILGAGLGALGIWLWPADPTRGSSLAFIPTGTGGALVGTF